MNTKGLMNVLIIIAVVAALGAAGYFTYVKKTERISTNEPSPTPQAETSDWNVYTNPLRTFPTSVLQERLSKELLAQTLKDCKKEGLHFCVPAFSIKYPPSWDVKTFCELAAETNTFSIDRCSETYEPTTIFFSTEKLVLRPTRIPAAMSIDIQYDVDADKLFYDYVRYFKIFKVDEINIGGITAKRISGDFKDQMNEDRVFHTSKIFVSIHGNLLLISYSAQEQIIEQMLSTFRFLITTEPQG